MTYVFRVHFLLQDKFSLVESAESVDLVLVFSSYLDFFGRLFVRLGQLAGVSGKFIQRHRGEGVTILRCIIEAMVGGCGC